MSQVLMIYISLSHAGMEFSSEVGRSTFFSSSSSFHFNSLLPKQLGKLFSQVRKRAVAFLRSLSTPKKEAKSCIIFFFAYVHLFSIFFPRPPSCLLPPLLCCYNSEHKRAESASLDTAAEYSAASCSAILLLAISFFSHLQLLLLSPLQLPPPSPRSTFIKGLSSDGPSYNT